jgi:phosphatidate cytidylyltransferase
MALRPAEAFDPALEQRVISALVLAVGALIAVLVDGWLFTTVVLAAVVVMAGEWSRLLPSDAGVGPRKLTMAVTALAAGGAILALEGAGRPDLALVVVLLGALLAAASAALMPGFPPDRVAGGVVYIGLPALAVVWLRGHAPGGLEHLLWLLLVVWATDVCAYVAGRTVGGPKLAPRISPSKTWAGLIGGMAGAALVGGLAAMEFGAGFWLGAGLGPVMALAAQTGDLFESALKRRAGLKDSGHLIPGHGGLLDRVDGLVFAAPLFAALVWLLGRATAAP